MMWTPGPMSMPFAQVVLPIIQNQSGSAFAQVFDLTCGVCCAGAISAASSCWDLPLKCGSRTKEVLLPPGALLRGI